MENLQRVLTFENLNQLITDKDAEQITIATSQPLTFDVNHNIYRLIME